MEQQEPAVENQVLTKEQLEERQREVFEHHKSQIPFLEAQKVYETLIAELEEIELKRLTIRYRMAQMMAPSPEKSEDGEMPEQLEKPRTLKKTQ